MLEASGEKREAIANLRLATSIHPQFAQAHHLLGILLGEAGDSNGALTAFEATVRIDPSHFRGWTTWATFSARWGNRRQPRSRSPGPWICVPTTRWLRRTLGRCSAIAVMLPRPRRRRAGRCRAWPRIRGGVRCWSCSPACCVSAASSTRRRNSISRPSNWPRRRVRPSGSTSAGRCPSAAMSGRRARHSDVRTRHRAPSFAERSGTDSCYRWFMRMRPRWTTHALCMHPVSTSSRRRRGSWCQGSMKRRYLMACGGRTSCLLTKGKTIECCRRGSRSSWATRSKPLLRDGVLRSSPAR